MTTEEVKAETPARLNLHQKLLAVLSEIGTVEKDGYNAFSKYRYVTESQVMDLLRRACVKHGILILADVIDGETGHLEKGHYARVNVKYTFINVEDPKDRAEVNIPGYAHDVGDKAIWKAITGSYKYMAMKTFQLSSEDDPENDSKGKSSERSEVTRSSGASFQSPPQQKSQSVVHQKSAEPTQNNGALAPENDVFITYVPYDSREQAKRLGARFQKSYGGFDNVWISDAALKNIEGAKILKVVRGEKKSPPSSPETSSASEAPPPPDYIPGFDDDEIPF